MVILQFFGCLLAYHVARLAGLLAMGMSAVAAIDRGEQAGAEFASGWRLSLVILLASSTCGIAGAFMGAGGGVLLVAVAAGFLPDVNRVLKGHGYAMLVADLSVAILPPLLIDRLF